MAVSVNVKLAIFQPKFCTNYNSLLFQPIKKIVSEAKNYLFSTLDKYLLSYQKVQYIAVDWHTTCGSSNSSVHCIALHCIALEGDISWHEKVGRGLRVTTVCIQRCHALRNQHHGIFDHDWGSPTSDIWM